MRVSEYASCDATELASLIKSGQVSSLEVSECAARAVEAVNPALNAVIEVYEERVSNQVELADPSASHFGVPILNKDLSFSEAGKRQEMGCNFTKGFSPKTDSTTITRIRAAGMSILGRTTTPEFGNSGQTESLIAGVTRNPWDVERTPGGSSGGSAAIVAACAVPVATASDGGGSTRTPASHCGLVGLKPSRGLVPVGPGRGEGNNGLVGSFAVTRTMRDCAALLDVMSGPASGDPYVVQRPEKPFLSTLEKPLRPLRIAFTSDNWAGVPTAEPCRRALTDALHHLEAAGHIVEEAFPKFDWDAHFEAVINVACSNLTTGVDALAEAFGRDPIGDDLQSSTWACYKYGKTLQATDLLAAVGQFNIVSRAFGSFFEEYDVLATPTTVYPSPLLKDCYSCNPDDPITAAQYQANVYANDHFVALANTTGQPAISVPSTPTDGGLPLGVQLIGRMCEDDVIIRLGKLLEESAPWIDRRPAICI